MTNTINSNANSKQSADLIVSTTGHESSSSHRSSSSNNGSVRGIGSGGTPTNSTSFTVALINDSPVLPGAEDSPPNPSMVATMKKVRPKTASPTRHGPQQCQVCSKLIAVSIFFPRWHHQKTANERQNLCFHYFLLLSGLEGN